METDIEKMYLNLNELLEDICKFLSSDKLGTLSAKDKRLVDSLINRSKVQLQEIAKIQESSPNNEYVDMDRKKDDINANVEITEEGIVYPYTDLSAKEASQEIKYGLMSMRRKFLLGFEKMKRIYATIHNQWLIIYSSEKDLKPIYTFDLKKYEAKETDGDKSTNFELMSISLDKKIYYFMALTRKDMLQWVANINRCHDTAVIRSKGFDLRENRESINDEEHYDSVGPQNNYKENIENEEEDIYLELDVVRPNQQRPTTVAPKEKDDPRPPLPGRRPLRQNLPNPIASPVVNSLHQPHNESNESIVSYDAVGIAEQPNESHNISAESYDDSFSEDNDEECTYEVFVDVKHTVQKLQNQNSGRVSAKPTNIKNDSSTPNIGPIPPILPLRPKVKEKPVVAKKPLVNLRSNS